MKGGKVKIISVKKKPPKVFLFCFALGLDNLMLKFGGAKKPRTAKTVQIFSEAVAEMWSEVLHNVEEERAGLGRKHLWTDASLTHG